MTDSMNSNSCSTRLSDEDIHSLWWIWAVFFKMNSEEGKFTSPPFTIYFPTEVRIVTGIHPPNQVQLSEVKLLSKHTENTQQYYQHWEVKSRRFYEFAVATELLNTRETKTTAVISPCVVRSCCSCCVQSLDSATTRVLKTTDSPAAYTISKAQFPLSLFGLFEDKLSKLKQQSVPLLTKINNKTSPNPQLLQVTSPWTIPTLSVFVKQPRPATLIRSLSHMS